MNTLMKKYLLLFTLPICGFAQDAIDKASKEFCKCMDKVKLTQQMTDRQINFVIEECAQQIFWNNFANFKKAYKIKYSEDSIGMVTKQYYERIESCSSYQKAVAMRDAAVSEHYAREEVAADTMGPSEQSTQVQVLNYETKGYLTIVGIDQKTQKEEKYAVILGGSEILENFAMNRNDKVGRIFKFYWQSQSVFNINTGKFEETKVLQGIQYK